MAPEDKASDETKEEVKSEEEIKDTTGSLEMSDDDFLNMPEPNFEALAKTESKDKDETKEEEEKEESSETKEEESEEKEEKEEDTKKEEEEEVADEDLEDPDLEKKDDDKSSEDKEEEPAKKEKKSADDKEDKEDKSKKEKVDKDSEIDYKAEYLKLTAPFKANGKDIKVKSTEDAVALMQMGANYHKKMQGLKPSLKMLKLLENNGLLDMGKINNLIDLHNKDPKAITQLIKDSKIDPLDLNVKDDTGYKPSDRKVSDTEIDLDTVLASIQDTPTYGQTLNVITKEWDKTSRGVIANNPHLIEVINGQMADGTYKAVADAVAYEKSMGRLQGKPDLDAYKEMGDMMEKAGTLPYQQKAPESKVANAADKIVKQKSASKDDAKRQERKNKVASTKKLGGNDTKTTYDPLGMSDEDFEKLDINSLPK